MQLGGDLLRRLLQLFGKLKRHRQRDFAKIRLLGLFDRDGQIESVARLDVMVKGFLNPLFQ